MFYSQTSKSHCIMSQKVLVTTPISMSLFIFSQEHSLFSSQANIKQVRVCVSVCLSICPCEPRLPHYTYLIPIQRDKKAGHAQNQETTLATETGTSIRKRNICNTNTNTKTSIQDRTNHYHQDDRPSQATNRYRSRKKRRHKHHPHLYRA